MPRKKIAKAGLTSPTPKTEASAKAAAPKASTPRRAGGSINKSAYVRALPATMSAKDIVAKAKGDGISLSEKHVYVIRSNQRKASKKGGAGRKRGRPSSASKSTAQTKTHSAPASHPAAASHSTSHKAPAGKGDAAFISMALDLGLARAESILKSVRARLTQIA
jgi:hypothetical protein